MKKDLILLAALLANDDNFALKFSSKQSTDEKFELVKTKFDDFNKEDFINFLNEIQRLEKENKKLSLEELENVSGGVGRNELKLAAITFLGLTLPSMTTSNIVSALQPGFYANLDSRERQLKEIQKACKNAKNSFNNYCDFKENIEKKMKGFYAVLHGRHTNDNDDGFSKSGWFANSIIDWGKIEEEIINYKKNNESIRENKLINNLSEIKNIDKRVATSVEALWKEQRLIDKLKSLKGENNNVSKEDLETLLSENEFLLNEDLKTLIDNLESFKEKLLSKLNENELNSIYTWNFHNLICEEIEKIKDEELIQQKDYYSQLYKDIVENKIFNPKEENKPIDIKGKGQYNLINDRCNHIIYGKYHSNSLYQMGGGHTFFTLDMMQNLYNKKVEKNANNLFYKEFKGEITEPFKCNYGFTNGVGVYEFIDSGDNSCKSKSIFPRGWFDPKKDNNETIKCKIAKIAEACIKSCEEKETHAGKVYFAKINGVVVQVCMDGKKKTNINTMFPISNQIPESSEYSLQDTKIIIDKDKGIYTTKISVNDVKEIELKELPKFNDEVSEVSGDDF